MHVAGLAPEVQPLAWMYPAGYGWAKRVATAGGEATEAAADRLFVDHAEIRRAAAASGDGCGAVGVHTVVVVVEAAVVPIDGAVVADVGGTPVPWELTQLAVNTTRADPARTQRIVEKVAAQ